MRIVNDQLLSTSTDIAASQNSSSANVSGVEFGDVLAVIAGNNPSNQNFTDGDVTVGDDTIAITSHGFTTGMKITELTTTGTLPAGLALSTVYYAIVVDANTIKLASSQANAVAGTAVDITAAAGGGTHTIAVETTLAGTIKLQKNLNPPTTTADWVDLDDTEIENGNNSLTISAAGDKLWNIPRIAARELRAVVTITSGTVTADIRISAKGK